MDWIKGNKGFGFSAKNTGSAPSGIATAMQEGMKAVQDGLHAAGVKTADAAATTTKDRGFPRIAGFEDENSMLFIARAEHSGGKHPGKIYVGPRMPGKVSCFISWGGREIAKDDFEYYVGKEHWQKTSGGNIPANAIVTGGEGPSEGGHPLYTGRAWKDGQLLVGKAGRHLGGGLHVPLNGRELIIADYEILVSK